MGIGWVLQGTLVAYSRGRLEVFLVLVDQGLTFSISFKSARRLHLS